jgi:pyruvate dehydrogenase E2 component (dihydrolipoamide acetyltransferase)
VADKPGSKGDVEVVEPSRAQQEYARRVAESKATIPHVHVETEIEVDDPEAASIATVIRAAATALREVPLLNGAYRDGRFELYSRINIGVAVAAQETLMFPTITDADSKDASAIAGELDGLATRARDGTITQPELSGATFSIADLRPQRISRSSPVIRGGQAATLAVGAIERAMTLTLACDNRILQGDDPAGFLTRMRELL